MFSSIFCDIQCTDRALVCIAVTPCLLQAFYFEADQFFRFLLLHFTSHFGNEPVCAINTFRTFGITEAEDLEEQLSALQGSSHDMDAQALSIAPQDPTAAPQPLDPPGSTRPRSGMKEGVRSKRTCEASQDKNGKFIGGDEQRKVESSTDTEAVLRNEVSQGECVPLGRHIANQHSLSSKGGDASSSPGSACASGSAPRPSEPDSATCLEAHATALDKPTHLNTSHGSGSATENKSEHRQAVRLAKAGASKSKAAPQVLPHVFNEAVAVTVHGAGGIADVAVPSAEHKDGDGPTSLAKLRRPTGSEDARQGQLDATAGLHMKPAISPATLVVDRQRKQISVSGSRMFGQSTAPLSCKRNSPAANRAATGCDKQRRSNASRQGKFASSNRQRDEDAVQGGNGRRTVTQEDSDALKGEAGASEPTAGVDTVDAPETAGSAPEKLTKQIDSESLYSTAVPSKAGVRSMT